MKSALLFVTVSTLLLTSCSPFADQQKNANQGKTDMADMMREHCSQMPEMQGCEKYVDKSAGTSGMMQDHGMMMDHGGMINSEEGFVINMIPHHQEAVDTAKLVVAKGDSLELKKLAQNIINAQEKEINMMKDWVKISNYTAKPSYENMMGDGTKLSGAELDQWFLMGMIMHHMGALQMAEAVLKLNPSTKVTDFAHAIIKNQSTEIAQMRSMLGMNGAMMNR